MRDPWGTQLRTMPENNDSQLNRRHRHLLFVCVYCRRVVVVPQYVGALLAWSRERNTCSPCKHSVTRSQATLERCEMNDKDYSSYQLNYHVSSIVTTHSSKHIHDTSFLACRSNLHFFLLLLVIKNHAHDKQASVQCTVLLRLRQVLPRPMSA
jgi:hypothetical protein